MKPNQKIAAREFIRTNWHLSTATAGLSVEAKAGYFAAVAMAAGPDILSSLTVKASVNLFIAVLSE
jgi:hypothetical protein